MNRRRRALRAVLVGWRSVWRESWPWCPRVDGMDTGARNIGSGRPVNAPATDSAKRPPPPGSDSEAAPARVARGS